MSYFQFRLGDAVFSTVAYFELDLAPLAYYSMHGALHRYAKLFESMQVKSRWFYESACRVGLIIFRCRLIDGDHNQRSTLTDTTVSVCTECRLSIHFGAY